MRYILFFLFLHVHGMHNQNDSTIKNMIEFYKDKKSLEEFTHIDLNEEARSIVNEIDMVLLKIDEYNNTPESDNSNDEVFEETDLLQLRLEELFDQFSLATTTNKGKNERNSW